MNIFMMLRQNLKQMFSLNSNGMNPAGKGEYESKNRKNNWSLNLASILITNNSDSINVLS